MKKASLLFFIILAMGTSSCIVGDWENRVSGNGNVVEETRDISGFTGVLISSGIDVILSEGDQFEVDAELVCIDQLWKISNLYAVILPAD